MAPRSDDHKLIIGVINLELVQPICSRYINVTDGQTDRRTDGRTDGRPTMVLYVHRAVVKLNSTQTYKNKNIIFCVCYYGVRSTVEFSPVRMKSHQS